MHWQYIITGEREGEGILKEVMVGQASWDEKPSKLLYELAIIDNDITQLTAFPFHNSQPAGSRA